MEKINPQENVELKRAIHAFIERYISDQEFKREFGVHDVDISAPKINDMRDIENRSFEISHLNIVPLPDNKKQFNFYVGNTEFHIEGKAAQKIEEMINLQ